MANKIIYLFLLLIILQIAFAGEITELSKKASSLKMGMTREGVINLLGRADWAVIPGDKGAFGIPDPSIGLVLYWKNPGWNPVAVQLNIAFKVIGWDEGRAYNGKDASLLEPSKEYSCEKPDRRDYCN
jgi:hypothetical protein